MLARLGLADGDYILVTAHRQETVDIPSRLRVICEGLELAGGGARLPVVWSVHPRPAGEAR